MYIYDNMLLFSKSHSSVGIVDQDNYFYLQPRQSIFLKLIAALFSRQQIDRRYQITFIVW